MEHLITFTQKVSIKMSSDGSLALRRNKSKENRTRKESTP
jgi:hypothetical protein